MADSRPSPPSFFSSLNDCYGCKLPVRFQWLRNSCRTAASHPILLKNSVLKRAAILFAI